MDTKQAEEIGRPRRRRHTDEFKSSVVAQCSVPGISIAAVALQNQLNANLLRRWVNEAGVSRDQSSLSRVAVTGSTAAEASEVSGFVPLKLAASESNKGTIAIEVRRGPVLVKISWPVTAMTECGVWLRDLLR